MALDYKAIGKRIKIARIKQDLTQEELAEKVNLSGTHISNIETGNTKLSLPTIVALANELSVSVDELLCDNVKCSAEIHLGEMEELFADCSSRELRLLAGFMHACKDVLRREAEEEE